MLIIKYLVWRIKVLMHKWEYKTLSYSIKNTEEYAIDLKHFESDLNRYSREGWELDSCFNNKETEGSNILLVILKKNLPSNTSLH